MLLRIQDLDGGFFEKFGSLLRQKSVYDEERLATPLAPLPEDDDIEEHAVEAIDEERIQSRSMGFVNAENDDSGNSTLNDSDSEAEDSKSVMEQWIEDAFGWNVRISDQE